MILLFFFQSCLVDNTMCNLTGKYRVKKKYRYNTPTILTKPKILRKMFIGFPSFQTETVTVTAVVKDSEAKIGFLRAKRVGRWGKFWRFVALCLKRNQAQWSHSDHCFLDNSSPFQFLRSHEVLSRNTTTIFQMSFTTVTFMADYSWTVADLILLSASARMKLSLYRGESLWLVHQFPEPRISLRWYVYIANAIDQRS